MTQTNPSFCPTTEDCNLLKEMFLAGGDSSFSNFKETWEALSFQSVLKCVSERNIRCSHFLVETVLQRGLEWLIATPTPDLPTVGSSSDPLTFEPPSNDEELQERLAGLYLLWTVVITQPYKPKVLVRTTVDSYRQILFFHTYLKEIKHHEGDYILTTMIAEQAFLLCHTSMPMCVPVHSSKFTKEQLLSAYLPSTSDGLSSLHPPSFARKMKEYSDLKQQLSLYLPHHLVGKPTFSEKMQRLLSKSGKPQDEQHRES